jgi:glycosyltransferase involved in cell wall biosynthesis
MAQYYFLTPEKIVTVRNGIDLSCFPDVREQTSKDRRIIVGTAARLEPAKGLEYLLQACAQLRKNGSSIELRVAGTGSHQKNLFNLAASLGVEDCVRFIGHVDDMPSFYRGLDMFVLPSLTEGLPLVVLEAMASCKPVIATLVGGIPEVLNNDVEGLLVPPFDSVAIAKAMGILASSSRMRVSMGQAARRRAERNFSLDRVEREISGVYRQLLSNITTW